MAGLRFDDFQGLKGMISDEWGPWSKGHIVTQEEITAFGELTDDMQWIHVDPARAESESPLKTTIAHGFLILSLLSSLRRSTSLAIVGYGSALNYGIDRLRFIAPVPAGSEIHCRTKLEAVEQKGAGALLDLAVSIHIVGHEKPSLTLLWKLLYLP